jgi:hexosaminidase
LNTLAKAQTNRSRCSGAGSIGTPLLRDRLGRSQASRPAAQLGASNARLLALLSLALLLCLAGGLLAGKLARKRADAGIVPLPQKLEWRRGHFKLLPDTAIVADRSSCETGEYLAEKLRRATGYELKVVDAPSAALGKPTSPSSGANRSGSSSAGNSEIILSTKRTMPELSAEGYELTATPGTVLIRGESSPGTFYGVQSLLQLFPPKVFSAVTVPGNDWRIPCVRIQDQPRFKWRGLMLDVSRHFFSKTEIERRLDEMALHKLNTFHWHLVDDQGWRLEIKRYPKLTEIGAWRKGVGFKLDPKSSTAYGPDGRYGGYYTQNDVRDIVAYAQKLQITLVPEIELPGHSCAALAAYPEFSCFGGPYHTEHDWGVFDGVYCAGKEETFQFLENVLDEVMSLFPDRYIHIGGDEVLLDNWRRCPRCQARIKQLGLKDERSLQSYFVARIGKFLNPKGRDFIGWSEIRTGGLPENALLMDWTGGAVEAASTGHLVVRTPLEFCYFNFYQSTNRAAQPKATAAFLPLHKVYGFEPLAEELDPKWQGLILGPQANLWTEYVPSLSRAEYMLFPRLCALAEVAWSPKETRNYPGFAHRLPTHLQRLDALGVNYHRNQ